MYVVEYVIYIIETTVHCIIYTYMQIYSPMYVSM